MRELFFVCVCCSCNLFETNSATFKTIANISVSLVLMSNQQDDLSFERGEIQKEINKSRQVGERKLSILPELF